MLNIPTVLAPVYARKWVELSPDPYIHLHLENWLDTHGKTIGSYKLWLEHHLLATVSEDTYSIQTDDLSFLDDL
jgi:hypothetical protein